MKSEKNIVLFGFMGTGKTALARSLEKKLGWTVTEMDDVIEEREGISISRIFAEKGEDYFRQCERELVQKLSQSGRKIIATGGGVVLNPDNISDFRKTGILICLTARPEVILERVKGETHRPLLKVSNRQETIRDIIKKRRPLYALIEHQIDTSDLDVEEVVDKVLKIVSQS